MIRPMRRFKQQMVNEPNVDPKELKGISVKTLVISGKKDIFLESHTRLIAEYIPDSQLVFINGDHFIANKKRPFECFALDDRLFL